MESLNPPPDPGPGWTEYNPEQAAFLDVELTQLGLLQIDYRVLEELGWSPCGADVLANSRYVRGEQSEGESWQAIERCLEKGLVQKCDDQSLLRMLDIVRAAAPIGPVRCFPRWGEIDYTETGLMTFERLSSGLRDRRPKRPPHSGGGQVYSAIVRELTARYFAEQRTAQAFLSSLHMVGDGMVTSIRMTESGPWRRQWWEPPLGGYKVLVETSNPTDMIFKSWRASRSVVAMEQPENANEQPDLSIELDMEGQTRALERHGMSWSEWRVVRHLGADGFASDDEVAIGAYRESSRNGLAKLTYEECVESLDSCIKKGWIWRLDDAVAERIKRHLSSSAPATLLQPIPESRYGILTLSLDGAERFRSIFEAAYGKTSTFHVWRYGRDDFPHGLRSEHGQLIERQVVEQYTLSEHGASWGEFSSEPGMRVDRRSEPVSIGPWCVYWWNRFPGGWKAEVEFVSTQVHT
jgi:hypothetical protein